MASNYREWSFQLYDRRLNRPISDSTGTFQVFTASAPTRATLFANDRGTSQSQPVTLASGVGRWFMDDSITSVDVSVLTSSGRAYFLKALTQSQHRVDVDTEKQEYQLVGIWNVAVSHTENTVSAIGFQLLRGMRIKDVFVQKTTAGVGLGAIAYDFGISADPDGFVDGITATVTGYNLNTPIFTTLSDLSVPGNQFVSGVQTRGALIAEFSKGLVTAVSAAGAKGFFTRKPYLVTVNDASNNLVFALTGDSAVTSSTGAKGYVYYEYDLLPTAGN